MSGKKVIELMNVDHKVLDDIVDATQASVILGVTRQHVVHLLNSGQLPGRRLTSTWITTQQAVKQYASSRRGPGRPRTSRGIIDDDCNIIEPGGMLGP